MAERRMLNKALLHNGNFIQLSRAAFQLYIYLAVNADDDGFTDSAATLFRTLRCNAKHLQELITGGWILDFENGVVVVTHWYQHNQIKKDRYKPTVFQKERAMLEKTPTGVYVRLDTPRSQSGSTPEPQESIDKNSIDKLSSDQHRSEEESNAQGLSSMLPAAATSDDIDIDYDKILSYYQAVSTQGLAPCESLTPRVRQLIRDRIREGYTPLRLLGVFQTAAFSPFLRGETDTRGWKAGLEWILDPEHLRAIEAGKYKSW